LAAGAFRLTSVLSRTRFKIRETVSPDVGLGCLEVVVDTYPSFLTRLDEAKNGIGPNILEVHHLDGNKWNLLLRNLAALC